MSGGSRGDQSRESKKKVQKHIPEGVMSGMTRNPVTQLCCKHGVCKYSLTG